LICKIASPSQVTQLFTAFSNSFAERFLSWFRLSIKLIDAFNCAVGIIQQLLDFFLKLLAGFLLSRFLLF
jgi:hypothetical protein